MEDLKIEYLNIDTLKVYENNSKIHTQEQIQNIANSIRQFGFNDPIGIAGKDNLVLEGHGRIEALRLLGITEAPCIRLDHMTEDEQKAYIIAHNHLNLQTGFDEEKLLSQLKELQDSVDMSGFGIDEEQYLFSLKELEKKELKPYVKVHYLISIDINDNDKLLDILEQVRQIEGVEIESSLN